jgi:hypothetical protein
MNTAALAPIQLEPGNSAVILGIPGATSVDPRQPGD